MLDSTSLINCFVFSDYIDSPHMKLFVILWFVMELLFNVTWCQFCLLKTEIEKITI